MNQKEAKQEAYACRCGYMTPEEQAREESRARHAQDPQEIREILDNIGKTYDTKTGHSMGCPMNVSTYNPGDFVANTDRTWARIHVIPMSDSMLEEGEANPEGTPDPKGTLGHLVVGLYRKR